MASLREMGTLKLPPHLYPPELLQNQVSQEKKQNENVGQTLKKLSNLLKQALEQIPELQGIVQDW